MRVFQGRNVHQLFPRVIKDLLEHGVRRESRNGPVLMFPEPVTTVYERPTERVIFYPERDANPFFHLFESAWMLGGREDVASLAWYVPRMADFSDDGLAFHGAYGYRWRHWFGKDQLDRIVIALREDPDDRRQVLSMWDGIADLGRKGKDLPCNLQAIFQISCDGALDMTVTNRSNDIIWGAYGANAVHFSYLHEYMACRIDVPVGIYRQVSMNFHAYEKVLDKVKEVEYYPDPYATQAVQHQPMALWGWGKENEQELHRFLDNPIGSVVIHPFLHTLKTSHLAYSLYRAKDIDNALVIANKIEPTDWRKACVEWLQRRKRP